MKCFLKVSAFVLLSVSFICGQEISREQKLRQLVEANNQVKNLTSNYLSPDAKDFAEANNQGFEVFRILPRKLLDGKSGIREGGSYYSFTTKSHDYDHIPQIGLEQNYLKVGFAGADYGFIADLGEIPLANVNSETAGVNLLITHKPTSEPANRLEQIKSNYETDALSFKRQVPATAGNTYILRAISFGEADILVAFNIYRKDSDGSLIIFWKLLKNFEKPVIARN
jgi:hypothetical protein